MSISNFQSFGLNEEKLGISYSSLIFSDFLEQRVYDFFIQFCNSTENFLDDVDIVKWWRLQNWLRTQSQEVKNKTWELYPDFPIVGYEVVLNFNKYTTNAYNKMYKNQGAPIAVGGFASGFGHKNWKNYSKIVQPIRKIAERGIIIQFGIDIDFDKYNFDTQNPEHIEEAKTQIGSTIYHELNHCYEHYRRTMRVAKRGDYSKPIYSRSFNTAITYAERNKWKVPKPIWEIWNKKLLYYTYLNESFELNARVQEMYYYLRRFPNKDLSEFRIYNEADYMENFDANTFYNELVDAIKRQPNMGNFIFGEIKDPDKIVDKLKQMWAEVYKQEVEYQGATPIMSWYTLNNMSGIDFIKYWGKRFNENGKYLKKKIAAIKYEEILKSSGEQ